MRSVRFVSQAKREIRDAGKYFEKRLWLGMELLDQFHAAVHEITERPDRWPTCCKGIRRHHLKRVPYALLYTYDPDEVVVLAVTHLHHRSDQWL